MEKHSFKNKVLFNLKIFTRVFINVFFNVLFIKTKHSPFYETKSLVSFSPNTGKLL